MRVFRFVLLFVGLSALAAGFILVVTPRPAAPHMLEKPPKHDVYLGTETCYVCHPSVRRSPGIAAASAEHWSGALHAALVSASANDRLHTAGTSAASIGGALNNGRSTPGAPFSQDQGQRYVLQTERGYAILPGQWGMSDTGGAWLGDCAGCHVVDQRTGQRALSGRDFSCETCHGPGGVHVDALVSLRAGQQLRSASAPAVDLEMCRSCHAWAVEGGTE